MTEQAVASEQSVLEIAVAIDDLIEICVTAAKRDDALDSSLEAGFRTRLRQNLIDAIGLAGMPR